MKIYLNGREIRFVMMIRNMSQNKMATKIGITRPHFNKLLMGYANPTSETRKKITNAFKGIAWDRLYTIVDLNLTTGSKL